MNQTDNNNNTESTIIQVEDTTVDKVVSSNSNIDKKSKKKKEKKEKKKSGKVGKVFRKIFSLPVGLMFIALFVLCIILDYKIVSNYETRASIVVADYFESPTFTCVSDSGKVAVVDNKKRIIIFDEDGSESISLKELGYNPISSRIIEACFDDKDNLYFYYTVFDTDSYVTLYDKIGKIDANGNYVDDIVSFDYNSYNPYYKRTANFYGLHYADNSIGFLYRENNFEFDEYEYSLNDGIYKVSGIYKSEGFESVVTGCFAEENGYAVILNNGDIGYLKDGKYTHLVNDDFVRGMDIYYDFFPMELVYSNNELYALSGISCDNIYRIEKGNFEKSYVLYDIIDNFGIRDIYEDFPYYNVHAFDNNGKMGMIISDVIIYDINDTSVPYDDGFRMNSFGKIVKDTFLGTLGLFEIVFFILGIVITFGAFCKWRMSILTKQLLITIPPIVIGFFVFTLVSIYDLSNQYMDDTYETMDSISYIASLSFDADELKEIRDYDYIDSGLALDYHLKLKDILANNDDDWSKKYEIKLNLVDNTCDDFGFLEIASSSQYSKPYYTYTYSYDEDSVVLYDPSIGKMQMSYSDTFMTYELYDRSIFDDDGNLVAVLEISTDTYDFDRMVYKIIARYFAMMGIFIAILVVIISISTYFNVKKIQTASNTVSEIAKGDFNIRIKKTGKDEIGDICRGVNDMADKLDTMFREKDENEQFYYKFVPEQFKDLLHKDKFTELSLGDAESVNLTVLFCDIRSFSLNSEMMTAKENFEFINVIYGIAGPIIRKHNGFVDKYIGDAVMALFENADDAVECGEELYKEIVLNPATLEKINISSIDIGIGIHTGMARIGIVGEEERMSGTVISNTVNLSSRLESLTKQYHTAMIITKDTLDNMSDPDRLNLRYLGMVQVAGVNEVKALYEVLDCLDVKRFENRNKTKNEFREAVRLYHLGNLDESLAEFNKIKATAEDDPAIDKYIAYIQEMIDEHKTDIKVFKFSRK